MSCSSLLQTHLLCAQFLLHAPSQPPTFTVLPGVEVRAWRGGGGRARRGGGQAVRWGFGGRRVLLHTTPLSFLHQPLVLKAPPTALPVQSWVPHATPAVGVVGGRGGVWGWWMAQRSVCSSVGPYCLSGWWVGLWRWGLGAGFAARGKSAIGLSMWERWGNGRFRRGRWRGGGRGSRRWPAPVLEDDAVPVGAWVLPFLGWGFAFAEGSGGSSLLSLLQHLLAGTPHRVLVSPRSHLTDHHRLTGRHQMATTNATATALGVLWLYGCWQSAWTTTGRRGGGCNF